MNTDDIFGDLSSIFQQTFEDEDLEITRETDASQIEGWDSFMHIGLIVAIEEHFELNFSTQEIGQFTCVGDVLDAITKKISGS